MENKKLLIGAGVVVVGYFLYKKSQKDELNKRVQNMTKTDVVTPQSSMTLQEKTDLFNKAIQQYVGGARPPDELLENLAKGREEANAKIKELKLDSEFSTWLSARPKTDYGMYPPQ
jgi:hypothetical protein